MSRGTLRIYLGAAPGVGKTSPTRSCAGPTRSLVEMGGAYHEVAGADAASALVDFARGRKRHPARARRQPTVAAPGAAPRLGHQPGAAVVGSDRPPHHLHPGE